MSANYLEKLYPRARYKEKLKVTENKAPMSNTISNFSVNIGDCPAICYPGIVNYLMFSFSPFFV